MSASASTFWPAMFSSRSDEWATPQDLFDLLNGEFSFAVDVCALPENAKCEKFFSLERDGLAQAWRGICWMNPPYSEIGEWMRKAFIESQGGGDRGLPCSFQN